MATFKIKIAEIVFKITNIHDYTYKQCENYLTEDDFDVELETSQEDIEFERVTQAKTLEKEGRKQINFPDGYLENLAIYRKMASAALSYDAMLFHGSAIAVDGNAYIFTAKSGTGKSTHARLWREVFGDRAQMVNDDKPWIKEKDGKFYVYGTPWNGKHHLDTNAAFPIAGIAIVNRAAENKIVRANGMASFPMIYSQTNRPFEKDALQKTVAKVGKMCEKVPIYNLYCNMDQEAAKVCFEGMKPENN